MTATFSEEALRAHNAYRERHAAPPLTLSVSLCKSAQEWAETLQSMATLQNSPVANRGGVGENISMRRGSSAVDIGGAEVSAQWYNDIAHYDFQTAVGDAGNFTQLVWIASTAVGFGKANSPDGSKCIVVAHYSPPGNVFGEYLQNVKPVINVPSKTPVHVDMGIKNKAKEDKPNLPKSTNSNLNSSVTLERAISPSGRLYFVHRTINESRNEHGLLVRKVKEIEFNDEAKARDYNRVAASSSESSDDEANGSGSSAEERRKIKELGRFRREVRRIHNQFRKTHGMERLKKNRELDGTAQRWAEHLLKLDNLANSNHKYKGVRLGENVASRRSNAPCDYSAQDVVDHWYSKNRKYEYGVEPRDVQGIGNFTQVVWKSTKEVGIGKASVTEASGATRVVVVCHYYPAGNVLTQFTENVQKPKY